MFIRLVKKLESGRVIDESTGCWLWTGNKYPNGYGQLGYQSGVYSVHRLAAHIWLKMSLDSGEQVNHKPTCPNKHCFNPEHLYLGNQSQNLNDYYKSIDTGLCPKGHPKNFMYVYTDKAGKKYKWCRECRRIARHKHWVEKGE